MDVLEQFLSGGVKGDAKKIAQQDQDALQILRNELEDARARVAKGTPEQKARAQSDIDAIGREMSRITGQKPAKQQDALEAFLSGSPPATTKAPPQAAPQAPSLAPTAAAPLGLRPAGPGEIPAYPGNLVAVQPPAQPEPPEPTFGQNVRRVLSQVLMPPAMRLAMPQQAEPFKMPAWIKGGGEAAAKMAEQTLLLPAHLAAGAGRTPEERAPAEAVVRALSTYKPGPEGQQILEAVGKTAEELKIPAVIPEATILSAASRAPSTAVPRAKQAMAAWKAELEPGLTRAQAEAQFAAKGKAGSMGAAMVEPNPYAGQITGEETARGQYPQIKLSKSAENVPVTEQAVRAQIGNEVLGTNQLRPGVVTGNEDTLRTEYTLAKRADTGPKGELLRQQIADEQVALSKYAEQRVKNTGASETLVSPAERGERINSFFAGPRIEGEAPRSLTTWFRQEKNRLYGDANAQVGNNPIKTANVDSLLSDPQFRAGLKLTSTEGVAGGAQELIELAKTVGFKDQAGTIHAPNTIGAWDAVRKAINANWTKDNAKVIRQINRAIDLDVAEAGGQELFKRADKLHEMEKDLLGSKGIKGLFGEIDSNGVETGRVPFDKLPDRLNQMPINQWRHIYDVADKFSRGEVRGPVNPKTGEPYWVLKVPENLRIEAESAKAEMLGSIAREVYQAGAAKAGVWNQNATNRILNARADKIKYAFPLSEQQAFHKLNIAGYMMPGEHAYEGAALQARRAGLIESHLEKGATAAGSTIGAAVGGPFGAALGGYVAGKAGAKSAEKMARAAALKEAQSYQKAMQETSKLSELLPK